MYLWLIYTFPWTLFNSHTDTSRAEAYKKFTRNKQLERESFFVTSASSNKKAKVTETKPEQDLAKVHICINLPIIHHIQI